jgi:hypothetical protein
MSRIGARQISPPMLRTMMISDSVSTPPSSRTDTAISENDSSVPIIQRTAAPAFDCFGGGGGAISPVASDSTGVTAITR